MGDYNGNLWIINHKILGFGQTQVSWHSPVLVWMQWWLVRTIRHERFQRRSLWAIYSVNSTWVQVILGECHWNDATPLDVCVPLRALWVWQCLPEWHWTATTPFCTEEVGRSSISPNSASTLRGSYGTGRSQGFVCAGWDRSSVVRCPRAFRLRRLAQNVFPFCSLPKVYFYWRGVSFFGAMHVLHGRRWASGRSFHDYLTAVS